MIGGNTEALLQRIEEGSKHNSLGEKVQSWTDVHTLTGWLDLSTGDSKYAYDAKLQESTHIFITDYAPIDRKANNKRLVVDGLVYDVLLIDDPMELHQQLEIYLKYVG
jgi:SPP1 family predicted phage head-tail adaptor